MWIDFRIDVNSFVCAQCLRTSPPFYQILHENGSGLCLMENDGDSNDVDDDDDINVNYKKKQNT